MDQETGTKIRQCRKKAAALQQLLYDEAKLFVPTIFFPKKPKFLGLCVSGLLFFFSHISHFYISIFCAHPERKGLQETRHLARQVNAELRAGGGKHAAFYQLGHRRETQSAPCFFFLNEYSENSCNLDGYAARESFPWPSTELFVILLRDSCCIRRKRGTSRPDKLGLRETLCKVYFSRQKLFISDHQISFPPLLSPLG